MNSRQRKQSRVTTTTAPHSGVIVNQPRQVGRRVYTISFDYFDEKESKLDGMKSAEYRKVIKFMNLATKQRTFQEIHNNIPMENKEIKNKGVYKIFWKSLGDDATLYECDAGDRRCIYYLDEIEKIIQIIAMPHHPESKKNK